MSSHPFVMVGSASKPGQSFSVGTLRAFHSKKFLFQISEKPLAQWKVHSSCTDQTKATASLVIVLVSRIQISGPGENNFVKWKETFRSDRLDQIRSVSVKGSHSQGETIRACAKAGWVQCFFFLSAGRVTLLHETGFLYIKGINFRIRNCNREGIRENLKILEFLSAGRVTLLHETGFLYIRELTFSDTKL